MVLGISNLKLTLEGVVLDFICDPMKPPTANCFAKPFGTILTTSYKLSVKVIPLPVPVTPIWSKAYDYTVAAVT